LFKSGVYFHTFVHFLQFVTLLLLTVDPVVEEVDLVYATPNYAFVRFPSGKESIVSLKDIAPVGSSRENISGDIELRFK